MKTITFYSYKGGVGRSLALANIATRLAEFGKKICLLDFDLEAPGLHYKFSSINNKLIKKGIVDYIYQFTNDGSLPDKIKEFSYEFFSPLAKAKMTLIPAGEVDSPNYWRKLSSINWNDLLYENNSIGLSFLLDLKEKIKNEIAPDFLLIDSRTGISEMSGITLSLLADDVVIVAANNKENLDGAKKVIKSLLNSDNSIFGSIPKITFVLSRVPFTEKPEDKTKENNLITKIKRDFDNLVSEINIIHSDRELEENEQLKIGYEKDETTAQVPRDYLNLFEKLSINEFSAIEISRFKDIKESERFFQKALSETIFSNKLEFISKAIALNYNTELMLYRALIYLSMKQFDASLNDCNEILNKQHDNIGALTIRAQVYFKIKEYEKAIIDAKKTIEMDNTNSSSYNTLAIVYTRLKQYEKAMECYEKMIQINAENPTGYNGRANVNRLLGNYKLTLDDIYKALELDPNFAVAFLTLAETNAQQQNIKGFYLNLEIALKLNIKVVEDALPTEEIYQSFKDDPRFLNIIEKYNVDYYFENE